MYTGLIKKTGVLKLNKDKPILYKSTEKNKPSMLTDKP